MICPGPPTASSQSKRLTLWSILESRYMFYHLHFFICLGTLSKAIYSAFGIFILSVHVFPGNQTHDLNITDTIIYAVGLHTGTYS